MRRMEFIQSFATSQRKSKSSTKSAGGLERDDIRDALEGALKRYLFARAGEPVERACPACADGQLMLKLGRFGPFVGCANYPECRYSRALSGDPAEGEERREPIVLGTDGETGLVLTLHRGRYGRYIQRGEDQGDERALRRTIPAAMEADEITPEVARALLALPRTVGVHGPAPPAPTDSSADGEDHLRRHRTLWRVAQARRDLRPAARRRGRAHRRPQPRGRAGRCQDSLTRHPASNDTAQGRAGGRHTGRGALRVEAVPAPGVPRRSPPRVARARRTPPVSHAIH